MLVRLSAATAAPTLTLGTGPDPTESITTQITATGTATNKQTTLRATLKSTGGQGCGTNFEADTTAGGSAVINEFTAVEEGPFSRSVNHTFENAGSYLLCGWLNDDSQTGDPVVASASLTVTVRPPHLGQYLVCAYVQYPTEQSPPEISASAAITAVAPPPPCVVPKFTSTTKLAAIKQAIKAAHCSVGKLKYTASRKIRSGYVLGLSPPAGKSLAGGRL